jgi:hypothetical protein
MQNPREIWPRFMSAGLIGHDLPPNASDADTFVAHAACRPADGHQVSNTARAKGQ